MTRKLMRAGGIALVVLGAPGLAFAETPAPASDQVVPEVKIVGRVARPQAVQAVSRVDRRLAPSALKQSFVQRIDASTRRPPM